MFSVQPFDPGYQAEHAIKHLSYHAYLRKLTSSAPLSTQSASYIPPLSSPSYRVAVPCSSGSHPSWPAGICTKCQPSAVTLTRQTWRMVDHVEFASSKIVESVLHYWRQTGQQRFGFLLGRYEPYDKVPMGVKAVVEAVHEPVQEPHPDGVSVEFPWVDEAKVERLAAACGLQVVGCLFTDLTANPEKRELTQYKRHADAFFLSSLEVLFAAQLQRARPTPSRFADTGRFSSRFVTCVLSGDVDGGIDVQAYQVSDQAMAMVDADMVEPSVDPGIVRVKEEGPDRYIPDVKFRFKNKYGLEVTENAKPCFPVEYLLVNVSPRSPCVGWLRIEADCFLRSPRRSRTVSRSTRSLSSPLSPPSHPRTAPGSKTSPCPRPPPRSPRPRLRSRATSLAASSTCLPSPPRMPRSSGR